MTTIAPVSTAPVEGTVSNSNDRGLVLEGESAWRNWSKFAPLPKYIPLVGEVVRLSLDKQGYIRMIANAAGTEMRPSPPPVRASVTMSAPPAESTRDIPAYRKGTDAETRRIVLLSVIKSACSVWGEDSDADPAKLMTKVAYTASHLLRWFDTNNATSDVEAVLAGASAMKRDHDAFVAEMSTPAPTAPAAPVEDDLPF